MSVERLMLTERASRRIFFGVSALLFVMSTMLTIRWCTGMSMREMPMPGGWTMSMTWMRMPGQTWFGAATSFVVMWVVMMVAMMLPSLTPVLWRYREVVGQVVNQTSSGAEESRAMRLTVVAGLGYFFVWTALGIVAYPIGIALATMEMQSPMLASVVPIAAGLVVLIAGALQFTTWKAEQLACCRAAPRCHPLASNINTAWRYGVRLGFHCIGCCVGLMAILFVIGVMDLRAMAVVTAIITVERLAPTASVARLIGTVLVAAGLLMLTQTVAFA